MKLMAMMDFPNVEAFLAIVRLGAFTRAADALHVSQPALSRRIGLLEHELGQPVFERGRTGARLPDGAAAVEALAHGETGRLTLAIVGTLASTDVTAQLRRFRDDHPRLDFLLRTGNSAEVSGLVRRGEAALGLRYFADAARDVVSRRLYGEPLVVVAAAGHPLGRARRIAPARLREEAWVAFSPRRGA